MDQARIGEAEVPGLVDGELGSVACSHGHVQVMPSLGRRLPKPGNYARVKDVVPGHPSGPPLTPKKTTLTCYFVVGTAGF
jgi:hypothetical protein